MSRLPQNAGTRAEWLDELRDALRPVYDCPPRRRETIGEWIARTQTPLIERCVAYSRSR